MRGLFEGTMRNERMDEMGTKQRKGLGEEYEDTDVERGWYRGIGG